MKPVLNDLLLILCQDAESRRTLRGVAGKLGCEWVEADSQGSLDEVLAIRRPTIAAVAVDNIETDGLGVLETLAASSAPPATFLVSSTDARVLASITRAAESHGLKVIGGGTRPLDALELERTFSAHLVSPPPIPREELQHAFAANELMLEYLPKIALSADGPTVQGVEALVRWQHPRKGLLYPRHFLDAVEQHDLLTELTDFVMTEALRQAGQWHATGLRLEMVINLSPRLVRDRDFPERLSRLLSETGVPADRLVLDVTEGSAAVDKHFMLDVFTRLRILGVGISLDNFGTGLSSLTELYRMPYSEIKVDHALMADVVREPDAMLIVRAIADLAHTLKLAVCAEGIENRQTLEFAQRAGFDSAQGRFFSGPVPASEIEHVVRTWPSFGPAATGTWRAISTRDVDGSATTYAVRRPERIEREAS
jgi:EAL domain-containing protein (putative c-di-GMP-specific phosphodiesterase class I)